MSEWRCSAPSVLAGRSQCASLFYADGEQREHVYCKAQGRQCVTSLLSPTGVIMPSSRPFLVDLPRVAREGPEATPLTSRASCFLTALWAPVRLAAPSRSRKPVGSETTSCAASLFGPAVTWRTVNEPLLHCPLCQVGCVALPEDFTCPVSLGDTGQFDWTSRSLHLSCHTGKAKSTGYHKPALVLETFDSEVFPVTPLSVVPRCVLFSTPCSRIQWKRLQPTVPPSYPPCPQPEKPPTGKPRPTPETAVELQCGGSCADVLSRL